MYVNFGDGWRAAFSVVLLQNGLLVFPMTAMTAWVVADAYLN